MMKDEVGGKLKGTIAEKENSRADAVNGGRKAQILVHGEGGEADIHPVDEIHEIEERKERHEPPADLPHHLLRLDHVSRRGDYHGPQAPGELSQRGRCASVRGGEVPEWSIGAVSKAVVLLAGTVGSNPTLSASASFTYESSDYETTESTLRASMKAARRSM